MKLTTRRIAFAGILAAVYAALTIATSSFAYGPVQFRIAEALSVLCCFTPAAIFGMVLGCMAANLASFVSAWDFLIGSSATLLACVITWLISRSLREQIPSLPRSGEPLEQKKSSPMSKILIVLLVPLPTILCNAVIVGAEIAAFFDDRAFMPAWGMNALSVGAGEAAVMYVLGVPLLLYLLKNTRIYRQLRLV